MSEPPIPYIRLHLGNDSIPTMFRIDAISMFNQIPNSTMSRVYMHDGNIYVVGESMREIIDKLTEHYGEIDDAVLPVSVSTSQVKEKPVQLPSTHKKS